MVFKHKNLSFYYEMYGNSNKTILILPGWGDTRKTFSNIIYSFKHQYTVYILDYPGFGNSPFPKHDLTIYDYADVIYQFIQDNRIIEPIIIAHSFGGRITSILLGKYQLKVSKTVLIDVAGIKRRKKLSLYFKEKLYKFLKILTCLFPNQWRKKLRKKLLNIFASTDYQSIPICMQKTFQNVIHEDLKKYYQNISSEVLILWGEYDVDTPLKDGKLLSKIINNSALIVLKKAGHFSYLDYSYLTIQIIKEYLKEA